MSDLKGQTVCFTGHRKIIHKHLDERLDEVVSILAEDGFEYFGVGGALGFDLLAAKSVLRMRKKYPHIKLIIVLPCKDYCTRNHSAYLMEYGEIFKAADKLKILSDSYYQGCMHVRNKHLVDNSRVCVCYKYVNAGGTDFTVKYAHKKGLTVVDII